MASTREVLALVHAPDSTRPHTVRSRGRSPRVRRRATARPALRTTAVAASGAPAYRPGGPDALLRLARDADVSFRPSIAYRLARSAHRERAVTDALAELLGEADQVARVWAAFGPAERDDPRCVAGAALVGPVEARAVRSWILDAPSRYEERWRERPVPDPAT
ncbi:hypothetical protein [Streptomyces sp. NPDC056600]|uniref:hypothetical protein n=1 Tax=Streptomyces sp. NPDC056600 TaxID=3345874 RepID=UPI0036AA0CF0